MRQVLRALSLKGEENATKTWRYLRLAMVAVVAGLAGSVLYERSQADCFNRSISAYFYTPVHSYFVVALFALGVALFCLKGNTELEDILLNLAGMLAPVVALVPTPSQPDCPSELLATVGRDASINNNMFALFVVGVVALVILAVLSVVDRPDDQQPVSRLSIAGFVVAALVFAIGAYRFKTERTWFDKHAHNVAAYSMFGCILVVIIINAITALATKHRVAGPAYGIIAGAMVVTLAVTWYLRSDGYKHWVFFVEAVLITLFAAFWIVQTSELWKEGLRTPASGSSGWAPR